MSRVMFDASANHVVWQRAQRTVRPAGPREAGSLMYVVEQLGQAISMGSDGILGIQTYQPSANGLETMATPEPLDELVESGPAAMAAL